MTEAAQPLIQIEDMTKIFYTDEIETHALSGVHLAIRKGEYLAMSGPSGCGKSTVVPELPNSLSEVLKEAFHACASCISLSSSSSATTFPSNKCTSRCACFAKRGSCVTIQIVAPSRCRFCNSSMTASPLRESRFPVGSSASRMDGCPASARATATRCC